jgi:uncharacterized coiled-coil DUF342 family protein
MEGMMSDDIRKKVQGVNARLSGLMIQTRGALCGQCDFDVEQIRRLREPLNEMELIVAQSSQLRVMMPELNAQLDEYKAQLNELRSILDKIRIMLLARQASLVAGRTQLDALSQWTSAFQTTR